MWKCGKVKVWQFENLKMRRSVRHERSVRPRVNVRMWKGENLKMWEIMTRALAT